MGTYTRNIPLDNGDFDRLALMAKEKYYEQKKVKVWGTEERFKDPKKTKIVNAPLAPAPNAYS